jgi:predicted transcriptional regulator
MATMTKKTVKKIADKEVKAHEMRMHGAKKMAKGGVTNDSLKAQGRNMARASNQSGG